MIQIPFYILYFILACVVMSLLIYGRKSYTLLLLIFIYLFPRAGFRVAWPQLHPLPIGYILMLILSIRWVLHKKVKLQQFYTPGKNIFLAYAFVCIFSMLFGIVGGARVKFAIMEYIMFFGTFLSYFVIIDAGIKKEDIKLFINGILIVAFLVSCYGILVMLLGKRGFVEGITYMDAGALRGEAFHLALHDQFYLSKRTLSTYGDPNVLAGQLLIFISILLAFFFIEKPSPKRSFFLSLNLVANIACLYLTGSRSSVIALCVMLMIFIYAHRHSRHGLLLFVPLVVTWFVLLKDFMPSLYAHRIFRLGWTSPAVIFDYDRVFKIIRTAPLGTGFGITIAKNFAIIPVESIWAGYNSFYLFMLSRIGIFGFAALLGFFISLFGYFLKNVKHIEDRIVRAFVLGGGIGIIAQQVDGLANNIYMLPGGCFNFFVMCGMLTLAVNFYKKR